MNHRYRGNDEDDGVYNTFNNDFIVETEMTKEKNDRSG